MAANPFDAFLKITSVDHILAKDQGRDKLLKNVPGCPCSLIVITRVTGGNTFAVTRQSFGLQGDEHAFTICFAPEGCFKWCDKRHGNMMECEGFDFHRFPTKLISDDLRRHSKIYSILTSPGSSALPLRGVLRWSFNFKPRRASSTLVAVSRRIPAAGVPQ